MKKVRRISMKYRVNHLGILAVFAVLLVSGSAGVAFGAIIYQDNFDNVASNVLPSPQVGTWDHGAAKTSVLAAAEPSPPHTLLNSRVTAARRGMYGDFEGDPVGPGTVIHAEIMQNIMGGHPAFGLNVDASNAAPADVTTGDGVIALYASGHANGYIYCFDSAGVVQFTGLYYQVNTWQKWEIDYVVGESSYTLTVDGNSATLGSGYMMNPGATAVGAIFLDGYSSASEVYVDDILVTPEPATLSVLGIGALLVGLRRRRN